MNRGNGDDGGTATVATDERRHNDATVDVIDDAEAERLFRHFSTDSSSDKNILMSALSALLGPEKPGQSGQTVQPGQTRAQCYKTYYGRNL
jgi:hypothetical protein